MPVLHQVWLWGGYVGIVVAGGLAVWRGGWAERSAAATILFTWFLTPFVQQHYDPTVTGIILDGATALILCGISLKAKRLWTLFAASSMVGALALHFMAGIFSHLGYFAYITSLGLLSGYYLIAALGAGVAEHRWAVRNVDRLKALADV